MDSKDIVRFIAMEHLKSSPKTSDATESELIDSYIEKNHQR